MTQYELDALKTLRQSIAGAIRACEGFTYCGNKVDVDKLVAWRKQLVNLIADTEDASQVDDA